MIRKNIDDIYYLKHNKTGERFDLKLGIKFLITNLSYDEFVKLTTIWFKCNRVPKPYRFNYHYDVLKKDDKYRFTVKEFENATIGL